MNKMSVTYKGLITGALMIAVSIGIFKLKGNFENSLQYITYALYIAGILWALFDFKNNSDQDKSFKNYFTTGFKCFIVVTFLMVLFTFIFARLDVSMKEQMALNYRQDLVSKGNKTPAEIDKMVQTARDYFNVMLTSMAIFGYLIIGAMVTLIASLFLVQRQKSVAGIK
jgi:hypothetical protein